MTEPGAPRPQTPNPYAAEWGMSWWTLGIAYGVSLVGMLGAVAWMWAK